MLYYLPWLERFVTTKECVFNKSEATKKVARIKSSEPKPEPKRSFTDILNEVATRDGFIGTVKAFHPDLIDTITEAAEIYSKVLQGK